MGYNSKLVFLTSTEFHQAAPHIVTFKHNGKFGIKGFGSVEFVAEGLLSP